MTYPTSSTSWVRTLASRFKVKLSSPSTESQTVMCEFCFSLVSSSLWPYGPYLPGSSVHRIVQARILEWVAISFSRDLPNAGIEPVSRALAGGFFTTETPGKPTSSDRHVLKQIFHIINNIWNFATIWRPTFSLFKRQVFRVSPLISSAIVIKDNNEHWLFQRHE